MKVEEECRDSDSDLATTTKTTTKHFFSELCQTTRLQEGKFFSFVVVPNPSWLQGQGSDATYPSTPTHTAPSAVHFISCVYCQRHTGDELGFRLFASEHSHWMSPPPPLPLHTPTHTTTHTCTCMQPHRQTHCTILIAPFTYMCAWIHACTCTNTHTHTVHTRTHARTHTHTHTNQKALDEGKLWHQMRDGQDTEIKVWKQWECLGQEITWPETTTTTTISLRKNKNSTVHAGLHDWHKGFISKHTSFQIIHNGKLIEHWPHLISFIDAKELDAESVGATKVLRHKALGERRDFKRHGGGGTWRTRLVWQTEHTSSIITVAPL